MRQQDSQSVIEFISQSVDPFVRLNTTGTLEYQNKMMDPWDPFPVYQIDVVASLKHQDIETRVLAQKADAVEGKISLSIFFAIQLSRYLSQGKPCVWNMVRLT